MSKEDCDIIQDLLPSYLEGLTTDKTNRFINEHINDCADCKKAAEGMSRIIEVAPSEERPNKKLLVYIYGIRAWYFLCPFVAFALYYFSLGTALHLYEGLLGLFSVVCIASQFFSGLSYGFDYEQLRYKNEAEQRERRKFGKFYTSPLLLCLPSLLTIGLIEIPKLFRFL